jgi:hypothetical protein
MLSAQKLIALSALLLLLTGCAATQQARDVEQSGFLEDYSKLEKGEEGRALFVYENPDADFSAYRKVIIDPVTVWRALDSDKSKMRNVPEEEQLRLANLFHAAIFEELRANWEVVQEPGPGVLRVRVALTEAGKANAPMNVVSTLLPISRAITEVNRVATGTHRYVGSASAEGEVTDAESGEVLLAAMDRRVGGKTVRGSASSWSDVENALQHWAKRIGERLTELRDQ